MFNDSKAGMVFEHSAVDGMVACLVAHCIHSLSEAADLQPVNNESQVVNGHAEGNRGNSVYPTALTFPPGSLKSPKPSAVMDEGQRVVSVEVSTYPDAFTALRGQRGLFDAWVNFSLQLSLREILGESAANHLLLVTPTHTRHYKHGRCDPTYSVTSHSRKLVDALAAGNTIEYTADLLQLFHFAFLEHKSLIKNTKRGQGIGPHIAALRQSLPSDNPLKKYLDNFRCPSVYITGTDVMEPVECLVGNVYAPNQLAVGYLWKKDRVCIMLNGNGSFLLTLEKLKNSLKKNLMLVMLLAVRYVMACEMGALEHILKQSKKHSVNSNLDCPEKQHNDSTSETSTGYTLIIHGGAGEDMQLNTEETRLVEFALQLALSVGSEVLEKDGCSLDAVQRSVEAMENCFLFNAGKGSVFNRDGKHELEATIVDGSTNNSGSVACLQSVKNPIKAARCVMENSQHSLIVGDGAEEFLQGLEEKKEPVGPEYFFTDIRYKELKAKLSQPTKSKNNHPQTVGALALDRERKLAAASSTGGIVGKLKGRVGDTAVVGAGIYADEKVAITCSGDGDVFLRQTVAQKIASLYHYKGMSLRQACREVMTDTLNGTVAGIIAVDQKGEATIEANSGAMFVASVVNGVSRAEVLRPTKSFSDIIWETEELVAYLDPKPWTPGSTILKKKTCNGARSIFELNLPDFLSMLEGARAVSGLLCEKLGVQRCALVFFPRLDESAQIKILPLHGLTTKWQQQLSNEEEFNSYNPGYCTSKSGPQCDAEAMAKIQARIRDCLPISTVESCFDYFGDSSDDNLFCQIVRGEIEQWRVWEDSKHVAFLTPYPNSPGFTVVVPRKMLSSDIFKLEKADYQALMQAIYEVAQVLKDGMRAHGVALIFEGFEIDYAHAKLIPLLPSPSGKDPSQVQPQYFQTYPGYVSSVDGPTSNLEDIKEVHSKITNSEPPRSWNDPQSHATLAINSTWYRNLFQIQNTLFHNTVEYFHSSCQYAYGLTPLTTDTISSPMGLGSDSEPVSVNLLGHDVYLADSMQFVLEYFLRFQDNLPGVYYISPSFRGEDPDSTHLNQFYHVECEVLGDMDIAMSIAEGYLAHLTTAMLKKHSAIILSTAGTLAHVTSMLSILNGKKAVPRIPLDQAIQMMPSDDCFEWVEDGQPQFGRKLTRKGERFLIEKCGGLVWLTEMDHLGVPFYQAYVEGSERRKAKAADLLFGLGETVGLGERHSTPEMVVEALQQHEVPVNSYRWYIEMRKVKPLHTSGWGMGTERYLCWLLQHDDIRDIVIIPRMKGKKYMP